MIGQIHVALLTILEKPFAACQVADLAVAYQVAAGLVVAYPVVACLAVAFPAVVAGPVATYPAAAAAAFPVATHPAAVVGPVATYLVERLAGHHSFGKVPAACHC